MSEQKNEKMEAIVSLAKRRGFIYQGSEVYGGLSGTWDYGPLGVTLKRNIMQLWWKMFVDSRDDMFGIDAAILMNQKVWQASGHVDTFTDPLIECGHCKSRYRVDHLILDKGKYFEELNIFFTHRLAFVNTYDDGHYNEEAKIELLAKLNDANLVLQGSYPAHDTIDDLRNVFVTQSNEDAKRFLGDFPAIFLIRNDVRCANCGKVQWSEPRIFNMMLSTVIGPNFRVNHVLDLKGDRKKGDYDTELKFSSAAQSYLRPETAQGIFTNYKNVVDNFYPDLPFGLAQQGKAFRNEISPRDFIFRSREFEQMEIEYFVHPDSWDISFEHWRQQVWAWTRALGLPDESVHELEVEEADRAHYSKRTIDFEFDFPIGKEELLGLAYRTDFDLGNIQRVSGKSMEYSVKGTNEKFVPHVIEPSFGVERALMAVLSAAYREDEVAGEKRTYLALPEHLAPVKFAVSPLLKNKPELVAKARELYDAMKLKHGNVMWDDNGNIGKRYRRQDEIGTPKCITIDFQTLEDDTVTVRDRDTTEQVRVKIADL